MGLLWKYTTTWSGGKIGTGFTNLYFTLGTGTAQAVADSVKAFFSGCYSVGAFLPTGVTMSFASQVDQIGDHSGELTLSELVTPPSPITGSDGTRYAAVAGGCVTWQTNGFLGGKRVRGRTFLVPVGGGGLQADGTLDSTFLGFVSTAAAALIAATPELVVWHRPTSTAAADGAPFVVTGAKITDRAAYLTSRR
jgi:hypothetical protein